ncbi:mitotic checkpoint serine/threonine-protein kinase BUB1 beta isoform X2 [Triplophysa rosa]|uniref:mitotic checkpoint serine/threonine-protein kinase BUB1 beta isoform X2 n=1 Tax=Triplophysa rosa TaxID=992332 RepID=UPI002545F4F3|nr:mitotic checkpoint serine/threonine-protein kinase BUB1 beta isoform X2 [Triplophysa rosa]
MNVTRVLYICRSYRAGLMALGDERAKCELSLNNSSLFPQKKVEEDLSAPQCSNPVESLGSSHRGHEDEAVPQHLHIMYCKDLVYQEDQEFSLEELRAQRYYKALSEKASHLSKLKQDLQLQIQQKLLQQKNGGASQQIVGEETVSDGTCESTSTGVQSAPVAVHSKAEAGCKSDSGSSMGRENTTDGGNDSKLQKMTTLKPFTVFEEDPQSSKKPASSNHRSLKLPTLNPKAPRPRAELSADRVRPAFDRSDSVCKCFTAVCPSGVWQDASIAHSEEPILNGHWNKTLCRSPNDTRDFAHATPLASTPFTGAERQKLTEDLNTAAPEASQTQNTETRILSHIQEISHDWRGTSLVAVTHESVKPSEPADIIQEEEMPETLPTPDVCSEVVRSRLLEQVDMASFSNFHRQTGALPPASGHDDLLLDGEVLLYCSKVKDYTLYSSSTGTVLMKVESSSVPWDFFISSKIRSSLSTHHDDDDDDDDDDDVHVSCYLYDNGCLTLWRVPHGVTVEDLLAEPVARADLPHLVIRLLDMVKRLHSCQIVHGGLKPETLYFYHSAMTALDFSASVDLQMQTDVRTAQVLSSSQDYITQGLLTPSASPYQVDLMGVAEITHMLVLNRPLKVSRGNQGWSLDEHHSSVDPVWKDFFQMILNAGELSTELVLSSLINNLKESL